MFAEYFFSQQGWRTASNTHNLRWNLRVNGQSYYLFRLPLELGIHGDPWLISGRRSQGLATGPLHWIADAWSTINSDVVWVWFGLVGEWLWSAFWRNASFAGKSQNNCFEESQDYWCPQDWRLPAVLYPKVVCWCLLHYIATNNLNMKGSHRILRGSPGSHCVSRWMEWWHHRRVWWNPP